MVRLGGVPLSALVVLLVVSDAGVSLARTLDLDDEYWINDVNKRNSWWSKKSVDPLLNPSDEASTPNENGRSNFSRLVYECYTGNCVPGFISCTRTYPKGKTHSRCKAAHRLCAQQCWEMATSGVL